MNPFKSFVLVMAALVSTSALAAEQADISCYGVSIKDPERIMSQRVVLTGNSASVYARFGSSMSDLGVTCSYGGGVVKALPHLLTIDWALGAIGLEGPYESRLTISYPTLRDGAPAKGSFLWEHNTDLFNVECVIKNAEPIKRLVDDDIG